MKDKKTIVVGLATSGVPVVQTLFQLGAEVTVTDIKPADQLTSVLDALKGLYHHAILGRQPEDLSAYDLMILSPGVPTDLPFILEAKRVGVEVIGEIELAYRLVKGQFVAITGTNGKTTTTTLLYEMYKNDGSDAYAVGNIGAPPIAYLGKTTADTVFVTELSSFQLESIDRFAPKIAAILNVTPDHLNRHKTMEAYTEAKCNIFKNMGPEDYLILNADNAVTATIETGNAQVVYFTRGSNSRCQVFVLDGTIFIREGCHTIEIIDVDEILIPGAHNIENALAAIAMAYYGNVTLTAIRETLKTFKGVEHRIEPVALIDGVQYFNDSKGTNPDSTIKAVEAMSVPTTLIAGGMDKGSDFDALVESFEGHIVHVLLFGETKFKIQAACEKRGFTATTIVDTLKEAVHAAKALAKPGEAVLLSPACASWDMYPNYEVRGREFKQLVMEMRDYVETH